MHHILVHTNQSIKGDKTEIMTQQYIQQNTRAKETQQLNPGGPTTDAASVPNPLVYR